MTDLSDLSDLTPAEREAIAALKRLEARWPKSLGLFAWSGSLNVARYPFNLDAFPETVLATFPGIPCDGGDP